MEKSARTVRSWKKTPTIVVPATPDYMLPFQPQSATGSTSAGDSPITSSPLEAHAFSSISPTSAPLGSPFNTLGYLGGSSSQPRVNRSPQDETKKLATKFKQMEEVIRDFPFDSVGEFLQILFYNPTRVSGKEDPRGLAHGLAVAQFLQGMTKVKMSDIVSLIYSHKHSAPSPKSAHYHERHAPFSPSILPDDIHYARPSLFTWATNLVASQVNREIYQLSVKDNDVHLRALTNGRRPADSVNVVTWEALGKFSIAGLIEKYKERAPVSWHLTECMAASQKNGVMIVKKRCPHPIVQAGAISSFVLARNRYASGDLAMALGVWHFAAKLHVDVKRVYSRFGNIVSDTTVRKALNSLTGSSLAALRASVKDATARSETEWCLILDNVQEYCPIYEGGIARQSILKVGTAATAIRLDDCKPGAFDLQSHLTRVAQKGRTKMTVETLRTDIDWAHMQAVQALHWARVLVNYIPELKSLSTEVSLRFRSPPISMHRMREGRKTVAQPLGTNAEREIETQGMARAFLDFNEQMGIGPKEADKFLSWVRGDGASYATVRRLQKYVCSIPDNHQSFRNIIATPEIWHTKATMINSIAANHYGPAASKDPSSLSRSSNAAGFKRPSNLSSCDYYPTLLVFRVFLDAESNLLSYFTNLANKKELPTLETLVHQAKLLVNCYASQEAYEQALSNDESSNAPAPMSIKVGTPWASENIGLDNDSNLGTRTGIQSDEILEAPEGRAPPLPTENVPKVYEEAENFDGDRVLANSILFLQDFGWWTEINYAISEGDIGRTFEIMKIWIFTFAGSSHQNYVEYLLEVYCLLRYDASKDLREGILNNWPGGLGKWIEGDLLQEHYNRWLEDMIKEEIENVFDLARRGKTHSSPHLRDEFRLLLALYKEEKLHLFCTGRSLGHAALNQFDIGHNRLQDSKLNDFISKSTSYTDVMTDIQACKRTEGGAIPDCEEQNEECSHLDGDEIDINPPPTISSSSETDSNMSKSKPSGSSTSSSSGAQSDNGDSHEVDRSNDHLVSGSEYDFYISEDGLTHKAWHAQLDEEDNSSEDEDEQDSVLFSDNEIAGEDGGSYDSD
ncbi:hypothetical protein CVT25_011485 [Psilocybe cyanescens]|uniref:DUF6589 domain-containing protein n=1 Tax=Psilocybe cyanescens TaxID=93625 RepID=A0A409XAE0_PSICY|nr:hypothetical protein CVT25_011485 [Psilocybe cyanescens]